MDVEIGEFVVFLYPQISSKQRRRNVLRNVSLRHIIFHQFPTTLFHNFFLKVPKTFPKTIQMY